MDLQFTCQASGDMNEAKPYGYGVRYGQVFSVELRDAERMYKMLKRVEKARESFPIQPETFGQFVQLMCQALGVKRVVKAGAGNGWHSETEYTTWKPTEIQWLVDRRIGDFLTANKDAMAAAKRY